MESDSSVGAAQPLSEEFGVTDWRAWHIFVHHPAYLERMITEVITPALEEQKQDSPGLEWFFLRYWENGPHIRLRLRNLAHDQFVALGHQLERRAQNLIADAPETRQGFPEDMPVDGWHSSANAAPWYDQGSVMEVIYEPEYRRYGGKFALALAEQVFGSSSQLANSIIRQTAGTPEMRQSISLGLTAAAISTTLSDRDSLMAFAKMMASNWKGFITEADLVEQQITTAYAASASQIAQTVACVVQETGATFPSIADKWRTFLLRYTNALQNLGKERRLISPMSGALPKGKDEIDVAITSIIFSQIHMMNNRLGITPTQEYIMARLYEYHLKND